MGEIGGSQEYKGQRGTDKEKYLCMCVHTCMRTHTHTHTHTHTDCPRTIFSV